MYVYLGREWELRVDFGLEVQFSCWNKYWSLGWLHWKFYQLWDWLLILLSLDFLIHRMWMSVVIFPPSLSFLSAFSALFPAPSLAVPFLKWQWTLVSASLFYNEGAHISDSFHPAPAHARNTRRMADMEMPPIYIHLVFGSSTKYEWVLNFISKSILNSNVSHL